MGEENVVDAQDLYYRIKYVDHQFAKRENFPVSILEKAETLKIMKEAGLSGEGALKAAGFTDEEIASFDIDITPPFGDAINLPEVAQNNANDGF